MFYNHKFQCKYVLEKVTNLVVQIVVLRGISAILGTLIILKQRNRSSDNPDLRLIRISCVGPLKSGLIEVYCNDQRRIAVRSTAVTLSLFDANRSICVFDGPPQSKA